MDSANSNAAVIQNGVISTKTGTYAYHPVFAREQLTAGESCQIEIVDYVNGPFMIGVATAELRNREGEYDSSNSMCIDAYESTLYSDGK